jgi:putative DNA primase/helicase
VTTTTSPKAAALHLWQLGANITAIPVGGKKPSHEWNNPTAPWATERQPREVVTSIKWRTSPEWWNGKKQEPIETIGTIDGIGEDTPWRTLDVDAAAGADGGKQTVPESVRDALLDALGLDAGYPWCGRSKSGKGWHVKVRCAGDLPDDIAAARSDRSAAEGGGAGVKVGVPNERFAGAYDHIELRWEHCQSVLPSPTGYNGHLPDAAPALVTVDQVVTAFRAVADPKARKAMPATPATPSSASRASEPYDGPDVIGEFNYRFTVAEILERNGYEPTSDGWAHPRTSQPGVTGVRLASDGKAQSFSATDLLNDGHNHDAYDCKRILEHGGDGKAAFRAAAQEVGITLKAPSTTNPTPITPLATLSRGFLLKCLKEEEAGDAQLFAKLYAGRYIFDRAAGAWFEFHAHAWHRLGGPPRPAVWGGMAAAYLALAAELQGESEKADEDEQKKLATQVELLIGRAKQLRRLNRCNAVLTLAGDPGMLSIEGTEWDRDLWALAVANGVLNLRTGELRDGRPEDYIRTQAPTPWAGLDAPAPRWARFMVEVMSGEAERVTFLQRALGYAMNGTTREHMLVLLVGERGRNGKGVLFDTLRAILGDYAASVNNDVIIGQTFRRTAGSAQPHLVSLRGKRITYTSETADGDQMSAAQVKLITGGDRITARDLFEKDVTFTPTHTLFVATNRRPHAPADDDALWERVKVLEFKSRFVDEPHAPDERPRDPKLAETLAAEAPGILAWLVRGHLDYLRDGLRTPESVKLARDAYRRGESVDPFIEARCVEWDGADAEAGALWAAYLTWCEAEGLRPKSQHWFGRQLAARYEKGRTSAGRTCYYGVELSQDKVQTTEKGSDRIKTPQNGHAPEVPTRFSEPFTPLCDPIPEKSSHDRKGLKNGSEGSEGSVTTVGGLAEDEEFARLVAEEEARGLLGGEQ